MEGETPEYIMDEEEYEEEDEEEERTSRSMMQRRLRSKSLHHHRNAVKPMVYEPEEMDEEMAEPEPNESSMPINIPSETIKVKCNAVLYLPTSS